MDYDKLSKEQSSLIDFDDNYSTKEVCLLDAAYQAFQKGILCTDLNFLDSNYIKPSLKDEYKFIKKYYSKYWSVFVLFIRMVSFENPFSEIKAFLESHKVNRINLYNRYKDAPNFLTISSELINSYKLISVIIPTLNRYDYLENVLLDFEKQSYKNFQIVIVDQSDNFDPNFYKKYNLDIHLIRQEEKALWLARNTGVEHAKSEIIAFSEDDVRIPTDWIENHLRCLDYYNADISNGVFFPQGKSVPVDRQMFKYAEQFATGNACMYKYVFFKTELFDRQFEKMRSGDGEFGLRCYLHGFKAINNPLAFCIDVKAKTGGLREMGSWDAFRPKKLFAPRPVPSVLYMIRKYFGVEAALYTVLISVPPSFLPYKYKRSNYKFILGFFLYLFFFPFMFYVVLKAWNKSTKMLQEGHKISKLA